MEVKIRIVAGFIGFALALATASLAQDKMKLGKTLYFYVLDGAIEPGRAMHLFRADRGGRKGQHLLAWTDAAVELPAQANVRHLEYRLLGAHAVGDMPEVDVLGIHYIKVRPERRDTFERFVGDKLHPAVANLRPDLRLLYYKSVAREDAGNYVALFALTKASRDKYWPGGSDSDELRAAFTPAVKALTSELRTYLVEGSYLADEKFAAAVFESREWTDFVLVPPSRR